MGYTNISVAGNPSETVYRRTIWVNNASAAGLLTHPEGISETQPMTSLFGTNGAIALAASVGQNQPVLIRCGVLHAENISAADMASDTGSAKNIKIQSDGWGANRATLTWTTATSTWLFDTTGIWLDNFVLNMEPGTGTVSVAAPITMSAASCGITRCTARTSTDASNLATIPVAITASDCFLANNQFVGATAGECTTIVDISGNARLRMENNYFQAATSSTGVGVVRFKTTAPTSVRLLRNTYINLKASSAMAVTGVAGVTGESREEMFMCLDNTITTPWGTSNGSVAFYEPKFINLAGETGGVAGVVSA